MSNKSLIALIVGVVVAIAAWNCFYIVAQTERAVLLQFGRVVQADVQPGLHVKVPYVNKVRKFDARLMTLDAPTQRFLTLEKKAVMVDAYAKWRVKDAERFYTATSGLKQIADERLSVAWNRACVTSSVSARCMKWCPASVMRSWPISLVR